MDVESGAGVADGAKTGLASLVTGTCFLVSTFFAPIVSAIPPLATGPILVIVGSLMFGEVARIDWHDHEESMPSFLAIVTMAFTFNIGYGIIFGVALWMLMQVLLVPYRLMNGIDPFIRVRGKTDHTKENVCE